MARLFALVPVILEVASLLIAGQVIGPLATFGAVVAGAIIGGAILVRLGRAFFADLDRTLKSGQAPEGPVLRAICLLAAGLLFICPGFFSDILAVLLLVPSARALLAPMVWRRMVRPGQSAGPRGPFGGSHSRDGRGGSTTILDGDYKDVTDEQKKDAPEILPPRREE
ncbi:FxsA family protein [Lacibacterium aquatile]|uniref:FxsA family protein n=1 Tax=Lacibacterium aquatile TaxID=1168082 RepID=A0ABW5DVY9_9PROT